jgi:cold shock CspA family protein
MRGTVAEVIVDRGFGFIDGENLVRYFFHRGAVEGDFEQMAPGQSVEFGVVAHAEGDRPDEHPRAVNIRLAADAMPAVDNELIPPEKVG